MQDFEHNPFLQSLGATIESWGNDQVAIVLPLQPQHLNRQGALHGGVACTLMDTACGYSGIDPTSDTQNNAVTISLAINFIGSTKAGEVIAKGYVTGRGRKIFFARAELCTRDGKIIGSAQGSFKYGAPRMDTPDQTADQG